MKKGEQCSLQYHEYKHETVYVVSGLLKLIIGDSESNLSEIKLNENDFVSIPPRKIHRMYGITDCYYLESSTTELDDVIRIKDDYKRV
jgi:mannose-6-phosphate isomerase-like protein (cupin superfamily)